KFIIPAFSRTRDKTAPPTVVIDPAARVVFPPAASVPLQLNVPPMVTLPAPASVPPFKVSVPPICESAARESCPPELICNVSSQFKLLTDCALSNVIVSNPGWLMTTSSPGPGRLGLLDQLDGTVHEPSASTIQETVAASADAAAEKTARRARAIKRGAGA